MEESLSIDEKFIHNIFKKYQKTKLILCDQTNNLQENSIVYGQENDSKQLFEYQHYLQTIETILALMPKVEYFCLIQEFLNDDQT